MARSFLASGVTSGVAWGVGFWQDVRFGLRLLFKSPTFTAVAVLTLGLGIGAITAIFSVVSAVLLRPLPFPHSEELVQFYTQFPTMKFDKFWLSPPEYRDLTVDARSYRAVTAYSMAGAAFIAKDRPIRSPAAYTTATFAQTMGVSPAFGRYFRPEEDLPGDAHAVVISHRLFMNAFGGNPEVVGRRVVVDAVPATIVGVMPEDFTYPQADTDLWIPLGLDPASIARGNHRLTVVGRLAPGVSVDQARGELASLTAGWTATGQQHRISFDKHPMIIQSLKGEVIGSVRWTLWLLQAAVLFVLLIACANVSNLLLARAEARTREIAIRNALGADRSRLVRQFLTESILLGLLGGALGFLFAVWGVDMTVSLLPEGAPRASEIHIDLAVLAFAISCALGTSLLFGLAPIVHTRVADLGAVLKDGSRSVTGQRQRFRRVLVVVEVALAVVLVIGCGLVVKSFVRLSQVDTGFRPAGLATGQIEITDKTYPKDEDAIAYWRNLEDMTARQPGVTAVTVMGGLPPWRRINANDAQFEGKTEDKDGPAFNIDFWQFAGDDYFHTLGLRLVAGRFLDQNDTETSEPVVVINEALARRFYAGEDPIGKRLKAAPWVKDGPWERIVGVVADVKQQGLDAPTGTEVYLGLRQSKVTTGNAPRNLHLVARTSGDPRALVPVLRNVVTKLDATVPIYRVRTMDAVLYDAVGKPRFVTFLLGVFAAIALALAAIGIYGVMSYSVAQRTRELGIRMALGAQASGVRRLVLLDGLLLAGVGVAVGLAIAWGVNTGLASGLSGLLYQVKAVDPPTFVVVGALVLAVAGLACLVPAIRATRVDPMIALRQD
jgi:putative ABC transport system permease protein